MPRRVVPILARAINCCWFGFKWSIVLALVVGAAVALHFYRQMDDEIRRRVETRIAQHYGNLKVTIRSAALVEAKGIRIHDLSIAEPGAAGPHTEILHIEEALLECSTDLKDLVQGDPTVRRVTVRRPTLRATRRPDGTWSAAKLLPPPHFGERPPEVTVEGGLIEIFDPLKTRTSTLTLRDVNLSLVPDNSSLPQLGEGPNKNSSRPLGEGPGVRATGMRRLQGMFSGDALRRVVVEGSVDLHAATCSLRGQVEGLEISPEFRESLPDPLATKLSALGGLHGQSDLRFELSYDPAAALPLKFDVAGRLARGRIDDSRLPHALTDIRADVHIHNGGYTVNDLVARSGDTALRMSCRRSGFETASPLALVAEIRQLDLDRALLNILPQEAQDQWYKYRPAGIVDADVKLSFDGQAWRPEMAVRGQDVSFTHHKFPYRVEHGKGTLDLKDDRLNVSLIAYSGSRPVRVAAEVAHPFDGPTGWFEAKGDDIQIDESLLVALPEKPREVARALDPRGMVNFYIRMWRDQPNEPMHQHLILASNHCSIRYDKFPYPLNNVRGTLEMFDGNWTFRDIEGSNDKARVTCDGRLTPGLQGNELVLNIVGRDVPLSEDLRDALSPHIQQVWHDLRPRGTVDLTAEIRYLSEQKKFSVGVRVQPQPENASIEPVHFPYRLDRLQGVLVYRDGHVTFERCKAEHGPVKISTEGYCDFQPDGRWSIHFAGLSADRLRPDRELIQALPERLRKVVAALNSTGPINLRGNLNLERTGQPGEPMRSRWDVRLGLQQSNLQCGGILVENVHGEVSLRGESDGKQLQSRGELAVDSLNYKDCQFTQVTGPIWIDDGRVLFGEWVDRRENAGPRTITAGLLGGRVDASGWVTLEPVPRYAVEATLNNADLTRCARELGTGHQNLRGKVGAQIRLTGSGHTRNTWAGKGKIGLSSGDVYELPVMIALLKILSIRPPDQNAFSDAAIEYRIEGEHIYLDRIVFHGDAISLRGEGEMDFQSAIRLTFYAMVGRGELDLPVIKQVFRGVSQQMMLIHVDGTLQNPETRREALPAVNQALQLLNGDSPQKK